MRLSRTIASKTFLANPLCRLASISAVVGAVLVSSSVFFSERTSSSGANATSAARTRLSDSVSTRAAGRGKPWINMTDGHELLTAYEGSNELVKALSREEARPLSLASADFDEDGMPDLVTGYAVSGTGFVRLERGNVDSVFPYTPEARSRKARGSFTGAPFLSPASVIEIGPVPELLLQGDFDADGHADLIAAANGSETIHFLSGDGRGGFRPAHDVSLPGRVTALTSGDINRADGLTDLVVATDAADGPKLVVFEGPEGALSANPEVLSLPSPARSLALGYVDNDTAADVAVAAGRELVIVYGRDRKLSLDAEARASVAEPRISRRSFPSSVTSVAIGDFTGDSSVDLAVMLDDGSVQVLNRQDAEGNRVNARRGESRWEASTLAVGLRTRGGSLFCARVSSLSHENLVMVDRESNQLHVWMDDEERRGRGDATLQTSSREPSPPATFDTEGEPAAVIPMRLNADALSDLVVLSAGRISPSVLTTQSNTPLVVCTTSDCTNCASLRDAINRANNAQTNPGLDTIVFSSQFSGIPTINLTSALPTITEAVTLSGAGTGSCSNNGEADFTPEALNGIGLDGGNSVASAFIITRGGTDIANFVIDRFATAGLQVSQTGGNIVEANFIGVGSDGITPRGSATGLRITSPSNTIGGTVAAASNVISSNATGIALDGLNATGNQIRSNVIGLSANGQTLRGNSQFGVAITNGATLNTIGGSFVGTANDIYGSGLDGVFISAANSNNVQRNDIVSHRRNGVFVAPSSANLIGGTSDIVRNNILSNSNNGVEISGGGSADNQVQRNFVGVFLNSSGSPLDFRNGANGVAVTGNAFRNTIGGDLDAAGNFIALNAANGVLISSGNQNKILSNRIFNNGDLPIRLQQGANDNQVPPTLVSATFVNTAADVVTPAAASLTVTITLTGTTGLSYLVDFVLYPKCDCVGNQAICSLPIPLEKRSAGPIDSTGRFTGSFTFTQTPPAGYGFVNATATSPTGSTSQFAQCVAIQTGGDFSLGFDNSTFTGTIGTKAVITVNIIRTGGFTGEVTVTPAPKGGGVKPKPPDPIATTESTATFKYKITGAAVPGPRPLTFMGTDGTGRMRTATVTLNVVP